MSEKVILPSQLIGSNRILLDVAADSKKRIFEEIGLMFENDNGPARGLVFKHLFQREKLGSTLINTGVAIPHARLKTLTKPLAGYLRCLKPVNYDGPDATVHHLFVLLAPEKADDTHLKILSIMSRMLISPEFIAKIEKTTDKASMLELVCEWERENLPCTIREKSIAAN